MTGMRGLIQHIFSRQVNMLTCEPTALLACGADEGLDQLCLGSKVMLEHLEHLCNADAAGGAANVPLQRALPDWSSIQQWSSGSSLLQEEPNVK